MTARGMGLEKYLDGLHGLYVAQGRALIFKVPTPVQITGIGGPVQKRYIKGQKRKAVWVDYSGVIYGGMGVALEAKHCSTGPRSYSLVQGVRPHQRETLTTMHAMRGVSALYVRGGFKDEVDDYLVPTVYIDALTKKSFRWDEVQHFKVPPGRTWLDAITAQPKHVYKPMARDAWADYCQVGWAWLDECPDD